MVIDPRVEVKSIERDAAVSDRDHGKDRPHFGIEPVAVHAEVARRVAVADQAGKDLHGGEP
jgi:hypothetical protein